LITTTSFSTETPRTPWPVSDAVPVTAEPFLGSAAVDTGALTRAHLRSERFTTVFRDVYVDATARMDLTLRSKAAHLLLPDDGALCGYSAAQLLGADCAPESAPAELIAPKGSVAKRRGLVVRQAVLAPAEIETVKGCRVTTPFRTAWDLGRRLRLTEAVAAIDGLCRVGEFEPTALLNGPPGARGCRQLAKAVLLADPRAESAMESRFRLLMHFGGLPEPVLQHRLLDRRGVHVATFDFAYAHVRLGIEYDGADHFEEEQSRYDRARDLKAGDLDWLTLRFTRDDYYRTPKATVALIGRRLAERTARPERTARTSVENEVVVINRAV
jgi:hypothetical protein